MTAIQQYKIIYDISEIGSIDRNNNWGEIWWQVIKFLEFIQK
jgi:hypothetical protein